MVKRWLIAGLLLWPLIGVAQEVLLPLQRTEASRRMLAKEDRTVELPFFDDFATGALSPRLWAVEGGATVSFDVSPAAPTVGVATLDALSSDGFLYAHASTSPFPADTLTSLPINLAPYSVADSLMLSFYYLPSGGYGPLWRRVGDVPEEQDSLFVDFYRPADSSWECVWSRGGVSVDTLLARTGRAWQFVQLPLASTAYMDSLFRFRFRNRASIESSAKAGWAGNCDWWYVDYVILDRNRHRTSVPSFPDVAFAKVAPRPLSAYTAMPYWQYTAEDMADSLPLCIANLYSSALATQYGYSVIDPSGNIIYTYDGGFENAPPFEPDGSYQSASAHASPPVGFAFPEMSSATAFTVQHTVRQGVEGDEHPANDTVRYTQLFDNYYAYDDGTSENGYGLTSTSSALYLAVHFSLHQPDTLTAVDLYFNATLDDANSSIPFYLTVWDSHEGRPHEVLYRDTARRFPRTGGYHRYVLERPVVVQGELFVGFEQTGSDYINIGFDRSTDHSAEIYYLTASSWQQSILSGSLLLRPCFRSAATLGLSSPRPTSHPVLSLYPTPAHVVLHIAADGVKEVRLMDMYGRTMVQSKETTLPVAHLPSGVYLVRVLWADGQSAIERVIITH